MLFHQLALWLSMALFYGSFSLILVYFIISIRKGFFWGRFEDMRGKDMEQHKKMVMGYRKLLKWSGWLAPAAFAMFFLTIYLRSKGW